MQIYLVRHADAVDETLALRDPHRHLSAHGRAQARALGDRLRWHDCAPDRVWSSPLVRAIQTAELMATGLGAQSAVEVLPELAPEGPARDVVAAVRALPAAASVVLVGHEPALSAIGALLTGAGDFAILGKAHAARIDDATMRWRFAWDAEAPAVVR